MYTFPSMTFLASYMNNSVISFKKAENEVHLILEVELKVINICIHHVKRLSLVKLTY